MFCSNEGACDLGRVGFAPTGKRRLVTAHGQTRQYLLALSITGFDPTETSQILWLLFQNRPRLFLRKDKSQLGLQLPRLLADGRPNRVIVGGDLKLHRQFGDPVTLLTPPPTGTVHLLLAAIQLAVISGDEVSAQPSSK